MASRSPATRNRAPSSGRCIAYTLSGFLLLRWRRVGGWREHLTVSSPMFDVVFIFLLLWSIAPWAESQAFNAGWMVGAFALLVGLSALSLRACVISATATLAFVLLAVLQLRTGISFANVAMSAGRPRAGGDGRAAVVQRARPGRWRGWWSTRSATRSCAGRRPKRRRSRICSCTT